MSQVENLGTWSENYAWESSAYDSSFSVQFPKTPKFDLLLIGAQLTQSIESHDVLVLEFKGKPTNPEVALNSFDPVKFTYARGSDKAVWEGYIYTIDPTTDTKTHNTTIICSGASSIMKDSEQKIYKKVTADQVVQKICKKHGLKAVTQRHPRLRESYVQAGQTDWQMLRRLAKQTGFALKPDNTSIIFMSKNKIFKDKKDKAPYFKYSDGISRAQRSVGTCLSFNPYISDDAIEIGARVDRVITGVSSSSGKTITTSHNTKDHVATSRGVVVPSEDFNYET